MRFPLMFARLMKFIQITKETILNDMLINLAINFSCGNTKNLYLSKKLCIEEIKS